MWLCRSMTEQEIIEIAKRNGIFTVSPKYRDYNLRNICKSLKKRGILKQVKYGVRESYELAESAE